MSNRTRPACHACGYAGVAYLGASPALALPASLGLHRESWNEWLHEERRKNMAPKAVVTGGTRGIGVEVAIGLARLGYAITVVGRDEEHGEQAVQRIGNARFIQADLSALADVRALGAQLAEEGPLQVLVNNVGGMWSTR